MNSVNSVVLLGHLTRNPRLSHTSFGKAVCDFGLALNCRWLDVNGDSHQETVFVDVTAWNQQAEVITEYCQKGRPVVVEGRLEQERWPRCGTARWSARSISSSAIQRAASWSWTSRRWADP